MINKEVWPINFVSRVFEDATDEQLEWYYTAFTSDVNGCNDIRATLYYTIYTLLKRRGDTLLMYYRDGLTLKEIGEQFSVTQERVRQVQARGIDEYRKKFNIDFLLAGVENHYADEKKQEREIGIDIGRDAAIVEIRNKGLREALENRKNVVELIPIKDIYADGKMSVRLFTCLKRAGNDTIGDVISKTPSQIRRIRNLGEKAFNELLSILYNLGVDLAEEDTGI